MEKLLKLVNIEKEMAKGELTPQLYHKAKTMGYLDKTIKEFTGCEIENPAVPVYKMVDTCAAEFKAETPYFYSTFDTENEAEEFIKENDTGKKQLSYLAQVL